MEHYFPFHKLQEYYDIFTAVWITLAIIFTVYVMAGLFYWSTKELQRPVPSLYRKRTPPLRYTEKTTTTTEVRQPVAEKKRRKLTKVKDKS